MAQHTQIILIDDLDGESEAAETVEFSVDGTHYEIDLTDEHAAELREALTPYIESGRRVGGRRRSGRRSVSGRSAKDGSVDTNTIRSWARSNGYEIGDRGRIPADVRQAFQAAH